MLELKMNKEMDSFKVVFRNTTNEVGQQSYKSMILDFCVVPRTSNEIREYLGIRSRTYVSSNIIKPLIDDVFLEYSSINVRNQKYVTVKKM